MNDKELRHWGVLGMKWGRRKEQNKTPVSIILKEKYNNLDPKKVKKGREIATGLLIGAIGIAAMPYAKRYAVPILAKGLEYLFNKRYGGIKPIKIPAKWDNSKDSEGDAPAKYLSEILRKQRIESIALRKKYEGLG